MSVREQILPQTQRRPLADLTDQLDLGAGDRSSKVSAFWTMLILSGVIAVAGVLADSTATVIGAMIIAPLSIPIMGIAVGIVLTDPRLVGRSIAFVTGGVVVVVAIGALVSLALPSTTQVITNPQVTGRTSPGILDLAAALATGLAGAVGLSRRDVSDILPGVAIAISLVPPLGVVGVCLGQGAVAMAVGAFVLFLSNVVALVLAGTVVFSLYGYRAEDALGRRWRHAYSAIALGVVLVLVPLLANTVGSYLVALWSERIQTAAQAWVDPVGGRVTEVEVVSATVVVAVEVPGALPDVDELLASLEGQVPDGIAVVVDAGVGERVEAGVVGQGPTSG
ncbi:MAG TPA: TIGR00341 family protein [Actinotalea sp.]|nr:TIGR00341 family protein [Actinotalea sp.]